MGSKSISELPNEILFSIFSYLKIFDIKYRIPRVCKQWAALSRDRHLWKKLTYETTSEGTKTFGAKSWPSTLRFLETTSQLQSIVISQGHSEGEIIEILNALNRYCSGMRQIEMDITPVIANHLRGLTALTDHVESLRLWLDTDKSPKEAFKTLSSFANLREITFVNSNPPHKDFQAFLANCPHLQSLNVANDEFCRTNFMMIVKKKDQFESLFLRIDHLDRTCIGELSTFPNLKKLSLVDNNASPEKLFEIGNLLQLETLLLRENASSPVLTASALTDFFLCGNFSNLRELKLHKSRLNDQGAAEIRRNCPALTYLEVITYPKSPSRLTDKALLHFLHCKRLESFEITFDSSNETDWIYRRIRYINHDCDIDGVCPMGIEELLQCWDEVQIPLD